MLDFGGVCPKKGISPTIPLWGWDCDHQSYSREGSGFLGFVFLVDVKKEVVGTYTTFGPTPNTMKNDDFKP